MKKIFSRKLIQSILAIIVVSSLVACSSSTGSSVANSGSAQESASTSNDKVYTFKWAHSSSTNDRLAVATERMIQELSEASDGRIEIEHYPASQLGAEREILEGIVLGTVDFGIISSGVVTNFSQSLYVASIPYQIDEREVGWKVYDGEFGQMLGEQTEKDVSWKFLGWAENSLRMFSNSKREIQVPNDMKGLKIRTQENDIHMKIVNDLGASATPVAFSELYTALQQGTVDGQENGVALTYSMGFNEVINHMTYLPHIYDPYIVVMSNDAWNSLPEDLQVMVQEYARKFCQYERELNAQNDQEYLEIMKKETGLQVYTPTDEQKQLFIDATANVEDMIREKVGDELVDAYIKAVQEAKAS
ncbi:DctP family TRAP transporter solute-binding subunit [Oscillospiraceae bacterium LTW-04]|nr:DctP family TRAP transporter solute-binding subunit [Oscillospiraceae bacterium MB24-C1]